MEPLCEKELLLTLLELLWLVRPCLEAMHGSSSWLRSSMSRGGSSSSGSGGGGSGRHSGGGRGRFDFRGQVLQSEVHLLQSVFPLLFAILEALCVNTILFTAYTTIVQIISSNSCGILRTPSPKVGVRSAKMCISSGRWAARGGRAGPRNMTRRE